MTALEEDDASTSDYGLDTLDPDDFTNNSQPATHMSPPKDIWDSPDDDMLDNPGDDMYPTDAPSYGEGDGQVDLSSFTADVEPPPIRSYGRPTNTALEQNANKTKQRGLFVTGASSSSDPNPAALQDLEQLGGTKHYLQDDVVEPGEPRETKKQKADAMSTYGVPEDSQALATFDKAANTEAAPTEPPQAELNDLQKWFAREYGIDGIDFT